MGLLLGDVLATIAIIVFSGLAAWAGGVLSALLFPDRTEQASYDLEHRPWGTFFLGLLVAVVVTFVGAVLFGIPATRAIGAFVWLVAVGVAVFGTGGLFRLVARRIRKNDGAANDYQAIARAGLLVCVAELMPFFGWFLLFPWVLVASLGAGVKKLFFYRVRHTMEAPPQPEAQ